MTSSAQTPQDPAIRDYTNPVSSLPEELSYLITSFLPTNETIDWSKAYLVLSAFCQGLREGGKQRGETLDQSTEHISKVFESQISTRIGGVEENDVLSGVSFLTALFQVDWGSASLIFQTDGVLESVMDSVDLPNVSTQLSLEVAHLLGQASGYKSCRAIFTSQSQEWLRLSSAQTKDEARRAAATIALIKLSRGSEEDEASPSFNKQEGPADNTKQFLSTLKQIVLSSANESSQKDAVEGIAYLSTDPTVKEDLANDPKFLSRLFSLIPRKKNATVQKESQSSLVFGILVIIASICTYRPRLTEEQAQIEKLRRVTKAGIRLGGGNSSSNPLDDDEIVKERIKKLVAAGVLGVLGEAVAVADSQGVRLNAGMTLLGIIEDKENRGKVLQSGGAKLLMLIIRPSLPPLNPPKDSAPAQLTNTDLFPIQALAKLAITSSPLQVFGPNEGALFDAVRPLSLMLQHPSSTILQRFEAIMALTNLSSEGPEVATRVANSSGLMNKLEFLLLEEHVLVRRAATELLCNLIAGSEEVFEKYAGSRNLSYSKSKMQVLLALSDVEDLPTRLAASGALATLTDAPSACQALYALQMEKRRLLPIVTELVDPSALSPGEIRNDEGGNEFGPQHPGLVHRGVIIVRNLLRAVDKNAIKEGIYRETERSGLFKALANVINSDSRELAPARQPAVEALKYLVEASRL